MVSHGKSAQTPTDPAALMGLMGMMGGGGGAPMMGAPAPGRGMV